MIPVKINGKIYKSYAEACKALDISSALLYSRLQRVTPLRGVTYEYVEEDKRRKVQEKYGLHPIIVELGITNPGICVRLSNCLRNDKIETMEQLLEHSESDLLKTPNMGFKSLKVLIDALEEKGLHLNILPEWKYKEVFEKNLSPRAMNIVKAWKMTPELLMQLTDKELMRYPNCGEKTAQEILTLADYLRQEEQAIKNRLNKGGKNAKLN